MTTQPLEHLSDIDKMVWEQTRRGLPTPAPMHNGSDNEPDHLADERAEALAALTERPAPNSAGHGFVPVSSIKSERIAWLWDDYVPLGEVTLLAGMEKAGKSLLCCDLVARVSRGQLDGDLSGLPAPALYLTREDRIGAVVKPRLVLAGADLDMVMVEPVDDDKPVTTDRIEAAVADGVRLVVLDPLTLFLNGLDDERSDLRVRGSMAPIVALAQRHAAAVLGIKHLNKGEGRTALNRVSGSRAYTAAVRSILMVADDPNQEGDRLLFAQGNLAPSSGGQRYGIEGRPAELDDGTIQDHPAIVWRGESSTTLAEALARTDRPESDPRPGEQADQFLTDALAEGRVLASEIKAMAADEDISKNTLDRAKQRLGVESHREGFGKGSKVWWSLADGDVHKSRTGALEPQAVEMSTSDQVGDDDGHRNPPDPIEPHLSEMGTYAAIGDVCDAPSSNGHQAQAAPGRICPQCDHPTKNLYGIDDDNRVCIECWNENRKATS